MIIRQAAIILLAGMVLTGITNGARDETASGPDNRVGSKWLATGMVTKMDSSVLYLLGRDNVVYQIDTSRSTLLFENFKSVEGSGVRVGDKVRVYGTITGKCAVRAVRVRVCDRGETAAKAKPPVSPSERQIKIIIEKEPEDVAQPAGKGAGTDTGIECQPSLWEGRGLITDIDYSGRRLKVQTSNGPFSVSIGNAVLTNGNLRIGFGRLNLGDAVSVAGLLVGLNEIDAREVRVTRTRSEAENAVPLIPISVVGIIQQIDYPSFTFKMGTAAGVLVVSADKDTVVQQHQLRMAFMNLRPGMRIKMSGYGSLATGYAAQHIQIIGVSP